MNINRALLFTLSLLLTMSIQAQKLTVEKMTQDASDLSARTSNSVRLDVNDKPCALVKVQLAADGAQFEGNVIGSVDYKTGEYWVYMSEGSRELRIKHPNFLPLHVNFMDYGLGRQGVRQRQTYTLSLVMPSLTGQPIDDGMRYLVMTVEPANATVYIDDQLKTVTNGTVSELLPMGQHSYRVEAPAYETKSGTVTIGSEKVNMSVRLESTMATLRVGSMTQGTQIYVNDQLRGTSSWTGSLPAGTYRVEGRLQGYRSHRQNVTLAQRQQQQVTIPALQAIVGNLNVNYQPANAEVWIDGKKVGTSPDIFRNLMVGSHTVELRADGYAVKREQVTVEENKTAMLTGALERQQAAQTAMPVSVASNSGAAVETITVNGVSFNMVRVEGGTFKMGATREQGLDAYDWENPVHKVTLSTYSIGETEVTQALWQAVMGKNPSRYKGSNRPVGQVSWNDCQEFIERLNTLTGRRFRLPTEAEWEYAARGGKKSRGYKYSGSNKIADVAWYYSNSRSPTHEVKTKQSNELGLYDMSGNVNEWCQDWYGSYSSGSQTNPTGLSTGFQRVFRGGDWNSYARDCRSSYRFCNTPSHRSDAIGLRLCL